MDPSSLPMIVEADALRPLLGEDRLLLVDLCSEPRYQQGHIPGAIHVAPRELVSGQPPAPGKLPDKGRLEALFSRLGLEQDTQVVAYDDEGGGWAGRFLWTLEVIGHRHWSYLNGGIWAWQAAGFELSSDLPARQQSSVKVELQSEPIVEKEEIEQRLGDPSLQIWDARGADEYLGLRRTAQKDGHIPGAIHCEWTELMDRGADLRIRPDARDYLASKGFDGSRSIVTHCQSHHRSGFTWLVGKSLGFDIRAYPGSWSEWGNDPNTPVETDGRS